MSRRGKGKFKQTPHRAEFHAGLDLMTLRSEPELKPEVRRSNVCTTQVSLYLLENSLRLTNVFLSIFILLHLPYTHTYTQLLFPLSTDWTASYIAINSPDDGDFGKKAGILPADLLQSSAHRQVASTVPGAHVLFHIHSQIQ